MLLRIFKPNEDIFNGDVRATSELYTYFNTAHSLLEFLPRSKSNIFKNHYFFYKWAAISQHVILRDMVKYRKSFALKRAIRCCQGYFDFLLITIRYNASNINHAFL